MVINSLKFHLVAPCHALSLALPSIDLNRLKSDLRPPVCSCFPAGSSPPRIPIDLCYFAVTGSSIIFILVLTPLAPLILLRLHIRRRNSILGIAELLVVVRLCQHWAILLGFFWLFILSTLLIFILFLIVTPIILLLIIALTISRLRIAEMLHALDIGLRILILAALWVLVGVLNDDHLLEVTLIEAAFWIALPMFILAVSALAHVCIFSIFVFFVRSALVLLTS